MTAFVAPRRRRVPLDPRILIGIALVLGSIAGVVGVVTANDRSTTVYTAAAAILPGAQVQRSDLVPVRMRLGAAQPLYLAGALPAAGYVAVRGIAAGEVVPLSALSTAAGAESASVVVATASRLSGAIQAGSTVDVWSAPKRGTTGFGPPEVLVSAAIVVRLVADDGIVSASRQSSVELQVPKDRVAGVLQAVADGDAVSVVAVGRPVSR